MFSDKENSFQNSESSSQNQPSSLTPPKERSDMIEDNTGLVHACAHRFKGKGIEYDDLFQAGCIGLIKAADAFDFDRGVKFSTYAVPVILGEMRRLFRDGGAVKISRSVKELSLKITRYREKFTALHSIEPTVSQLAEALEVTEEAVTLSLNVCAPPVSLTESDEVGGGQLDIPTESPEEMLSDLISLRQLMEKLPVRDKQLLTLRYFLSKTQQQTATILGMTQVQVSRQEKRLLTKLREEMTHI